MNDDSRKNGVGRCKGIVVPANESVDFLTEHPTVIIPSAAKDLGLPAMPRICRRFFASLRMTLIRLAPPSMRFESNTDCYM